MEGQETEVRSQKPEARSEATPPWKPERLEEKAEVRSQKPEEIQNPPQSGAPKSKINLPIPKAGETPALPALLDLAAPERFVTLDVMGRKFKHFFRPPKAEDWLEYERAVRPTIIFRDDEIETRLRSREAAIEFWKKHFIRAEGYGAQKPEARSQKSEDAEIPVSHRVTAIAGLDRVGEADLLNMPEGVWPAESDGETVAITLRAWWNGQWFEHLVHRFKRPLVEHQIRFEEAQERRALLTPKIGGQRKPAARTELETRILPQLPTLIALYDELLASVEGYTIGESAVGSRQSAVEKMEATHKSAAVRALFSQDQARLED